MRAEIHSVLIAQEDSGRELLESPAETGCAWRTSHALVFANNARMGQLLISRLPGSTRHSGKLPPGNYADASKKGERSEAYVYHHEQCVAVTFTTALMEEFMPQIPAIHTHRFSIADRDAVQVLLNKLGAPNGSRNVDGEKLYKALASASRRYSQSGQEISQAFFHGLLTGYAVGLKHK